MNGKTYSLEYLTVMRSALDAAPESPARDSARAKINQAIDRLIARRSERNIMLTQAETTVTTLAVARHWNKKEV